MFTINSAQKASLAVRELSYTIKKHCALTHCTLDEAITYLDRVLFDVSSVNRVALVTYATNNRSVRNDVMNLMFNRVGGDTLQHILHPAMRDVRGMLMGMIEELALLVTRGKKKDADAYHILIDKYRYIIKSVRESVIVHDDIDELSFKYRNEAHNQRKKKSIFAGINFNDVYDPEAMESDDFDDDDDDGDDYYSNPYTYKYKKETLADKYSKKYNSYSIDSLIESTVKAMTPAVAKKQVNRINADSDDDISREIIIPEEQFTNYDPEEFLKENFPEEMKHINDEVETSVEKDAGKSANFNKEGSDDSLPSNLTSTTSRKELNMENINANRKPNTPFRTIIRPTETELAVERMFRDQKNQAPVIEAVKPYVEEKAVTSADFDDIDDYYMATASKPRDIIIPDRPEVVTEIATEETTVTQIPDNDLVPNNLEDITGDSMYDGTLPDEVNRHLKSINDELKQVTKGKDFGLIKDSVEEKISKLIDYYKDQTNPKAELVKEATDIISKAVNDLVRTRFLGSVIFENVDQLLLEENLLDDEDDDEVEEISIKEDVIPEELVKEESSEEDEKSSTHDDVADPDSGKTNKELLDEIKSKVSALDRSRIEIEEIVTPFLNNNLTSYDPMNNELTVNVTTASFEAFCKEQDRKDALKASQKAELSEAQEIREQIKAANPNMSRKERRKLEKAAKKEASKKSSTNIEDEIVELYNDLHSDSPDDKSDKEVIDTPIESIPKVEETDNISATVNMLKDIKSIPRTPPSNDPIGFLVGGGYRFDIPENDDIPEIDPDLPPDELRKALDEGFAAGLAKELQNMANAGEFNKPTNTISNDNIDRPKYELVEETKPKIPSVDYELEFDSEEDKEKYHTKKEMTHLEHIAYDLDNQPLPSGPIEMVYEYIHPSFDTPMVNPPHYVIKKYPDDLPEVPLTDRDELPHLKHFHKWKKAYGATNGPIDQQYSLAKDLKEYIEKECSCILYSIYNDIVPSVDGVKYFQYNIDLRIACDCGDPEIEVNSFKLERIIWAHVKKMFRSIGITDLDNDVELNIHTSYDRTTIVDDIAASFNTGVPVAERIKSANFYVNNIMTAQKLYIMDMEIPSYSHKIISKDGTRADIYVFFPDEIMNSDVVRLIKEDNILDRFIYEADVLRNISVDCKVKTHIMTDTDADKITDLSCEKLDLVTLDRMLHKIVTPFLRRKLDYLLLDSKKTCQIEYSKPSFFGIDSGITIDLYCAVVGELNWDIFEGDEYTFINNSSAAEISFRLRQMFSIMAPFVFIKTEVDLIP